jgi:hypothetical protein
MLESVKKVLLETPQILMGLITKYFQSQRVHMLQLNTKYIVCLKSFCNNNTVPSTMQHLDYLVSTFNMWPSFFNVRLTAAELSRFGNEFFVCCNFNYGCTKSSNEVLHTSQKCSRNTANNSECIQLLCSQSFQYLSVVHLIL